jgi:DNA-binding CsgD family transcriptional regulator
MRVRLVGTPAVRARLRALLASAGVDVSEEFGDIDEARCRVTNEPVVIANMDGVPERSGPAKPLVEPLTPRETDVLQVLAEGRSNKAIAERLGISDQTVKFHIASICGKLGAINRTEAVRVAIQRGLIAI